MKKIVSVIIALTFVFTVSFAFNAQADGVQTVPQTQKVEKKKECKTACDKKEKDCKTKCDKKESKTNCDKKAEKKACCEKSADSKK